MNTDKIRIAVLVGQYPSGGAERQAMETAKQLSMKGFNVSIVAITHSNTFVSEGIEIVGIDMKGAKHEANVIALFKELLFYRKLRARLLGKYEVIIVFSQLYGTAFIGNEFVKVFSFRMFLPNSTKLTRRLFLRKFDLITCNNLPQYSLMIAKGFRTLFLKNVVLPVRTEQKFRKRKKSVFLLVSNFTSRKNIEMAVNAFGLLKDTEVQLNIAGSVKDKGYFLRVMKSIESSNNVQYIGCLSNEELDMNYRMASALIHPSRREGTSNAILDAMRYRIPAIVSRIPENIALVENVRDFLFDPDSPEELAERVTRLHTNLLADPHFYDEYLDLQEKKIKLVYSQDSIEDLVTAIEELVKRKNL